MNALADKLPKVYGMPAGVPLAKVLAECLWREYKDDMLGLSDVEIYLPNRRSCRSLADAFLEVSDGQATILPRLTPLGDIEDDDLLETDPFILDEDPFLQPAISPFERQILLTQMILKRGDLNLSVTEAFSLAAEFAALIDKAHTENVDLKKIDTLVPADLAAHWQVTVDFLKIVMEAWPNVLAEMGKVDPAYRRNLLLAKKADALRRNPPQHRVIADGLHSCLRRFDGRHRALTERLRRLALLRSRYRPKNLGRDRRPASILFPETPLGAFCDRAETGQTISADRRCLSEQTAC